MDVLDLALLDCMHGVLGIQREVEGEEDRLTAAIRENTRHLNNLHDCMQKEKMLAKQLDMRQTALVSGWFLY